MAYESQEIGRGSISDILQLLKGFSSGHQRVRKSIFDSHDAITNVINSAQTEDQLISAQNALNNIASRSSEYAETALNHQALSNNMENKRYAYDDYKSALEQTSDFMNSPMFMTKAEQWQDLDSLYKSKVNEEGDYQYDSVSDMMVQEYSKLGALTSRIGTGQEAGFRFKKAIKTGEYTEEDIMTQMGIYGKRLDTALETLINDGKINPDEAKAIMSGMDRKSYVKYRGDKLTDITSEIKRSKSEVNSINSTISSLIEKDAMSDEVSMFLQSFVESDPTSPLAKSLMLGNKEEALKSLQSMLGEAEGRLNTHLDSFKYWDGSDYASGAITDENDFIKTTSEEEFHADLEKEEKAATEADLMERYGTTDLDKIKSTLSKEYKGPKAKGYIDVTDVTSGIVKNKDVAIKYGNRINEISGELEIIQTEYDELILERDTDYSSLEEMKKEISLEKEAYGIPGPLLGQLSWPSSEVVEAAGGREEMKKILGNLRNLISEKRKLEQQLMQKWKGHRAIKGDKIRDLERKIKKLDKERTGNKSRLESIVAKSRGSK